MMDTFATKIRRDIATKMDTTLEEHQWFARHLALLHRLPNKVRAQTNEFITSYFLI